MQISNKLPLFFVMACLFLCCTAQAYAAPTLTISSNSNGVFVLQGNDLQVIGGAKITIGYDTSTLTNPRVIQGGLTSGAIFLPNTNAPGIILIGVVSLNGISGSGPIATINFDLPGSSPGVIQSLRAEQVIDLEGKPVAVQARVINPTASSTPAPSAETAPAPAADATNASPATLGQTTASTVAQQQPTRIGIAVGVPVQLQLDGTPAPPAGSDKPRETTPAKQPDVTTAPQTAMETSAGEPTQPTQEAPASKPGEKIQPDRVAHKSVLEQFRTFTGQKTPQALTDILTQATMPGIRQEPAVALSDGTSKLRLSIALYSPGKKAPSFSLKNATLVSLKIEGDSSWLIEVLPAKGVYSATLTMLQGDAETEIPLLVAPPLPNGTGVGSDGKLTEADFARFLTERGTDKAPRFDLNGDGKRDYIDDYIFTANYLLRKGM